MHFYLEEDNVDHCLTDVPRNRMPTDVFFKNKHCSIVIVHVLELSTSSLLPSYPYSICPPPSSSTNGGAQFL